MSVAGVKSSIMRFLSLLAGETDRTEEALFVIGSIREAPDPRRHDDLSVGVEKGTR